MALLLAFLVSECHAQDNAAAPVSPPEQEQTGPAPLPPVQQPSPDPDYYRASCDRPKDHDAADLCEQRRMAQAAEDAIWWARAQTVVGGFGFAAVLITLVFTAIATSAAARAANASVETVRVMRNAERPYLTPFDPELRNWDKAILEYNEFKVLEVHLDITNIGKGVGFIEGYGIAHEICREGKQGGVALTVRNGFARMPLGPDGKLDAGAPFDVFQIDPADRMAILAFDKTLYIYGYVRYYDLFNVFRRTGFSFEFIPNKDIPANSVFAICPSPLWWYDIEEDSHGKKMLVASLAGEGAERAPAKRGG